MKRRPEKLKLFTVIHVQWPVFDEGRKLKGTISGHICQLLLKHNEKLKDPMCKIT